MDRHARRAVVLTILFAILLLILSIIPGDMTSTPGGFYFEGMDKVMHALMYGVFALLVTNVYLAFFKLKFWPVLLLVFITWCYSIMMEILQLYLVSTRSGELLDAIANLIGIVLGTLLFIGYRKIRY
jgi:VanZ family protein